MAESQHDFADSWIEKIKQGDPRAADAIWDECFPELIRYAQGRLRGMPAMREAAEDVALSALKSFMARAQAGKFHQLEHAEHMWKILYCIAGCKAAAYRRKKSNQSLTISPETIQQTVSATDGIQEVMNDLLGMLNDDAMRAIGKHHLFGYNNKEISEKVNCSTETVRRKLITIKEKWTRERERWLGE